MYDAILLSEGFFTIEELPEKVELDNNNTDDLQPEFVVLSRTNVSSPAGNIIYGSYNNGIGPYITYSSAAKTYVPEVNQIGPEIGNCLLDDVRTNPPIAAVEAGGATLFSVWAFDTFKDTYRVEKRALTEDGDVVLDFTISRVELCKWCGEIPGTDGDIICLTYRSPTIIGGAHWFFGGTPERAPRNNPSPTGVYQAFSTFWIITEA
jgi:hypothetical protein